MYQLIERLRRAARRWKHRARLPRWRSLSRIPRLTRDQVTQGQTGFYPLTPPALSQVAVPLSPVVKFLNPVEQAWSKLSPKTIPELGCFVLRGAMCGGEGHLFQDNRLIRDPLLIPEEWKRRVWIAPQEVPDCRQIQPRTWPRPLIWFMARDHTSYGHWWLDILPRLFHLKKHHPACFEQCDLVLPHDLPAWAVDSLEKLIGVNPDRFVRFTAKTTDFLLPPWLLVPTMVHQSHHFHPAAGEFYDHAMQWAQAHTTSPLANAPRLFLTRGRDRSNRPLENIDEIEQAFVQAGYQLIAPEQFSWDEQIVLFAQAEIVAGEHGSAMKNMLFARPGTVQIVINHLNLNQAAIAALRQQPCLIHRGIGFSYAHLSKPYRADLAAIQKSIAWAEDYRGRITISPKRE